MNKRMTKEEMKKHIEENLKNHFIGAHATRIRSEDGLNELVDSGVNLKTKGNCYMMAGTVTSFGNSNESQNIEDLMSYSYDINGVIISVPIFLEYGDKTTFLGYPEKTGKDLPKDQDDYKCLMTELFAQLGEIPSCFILAHYTTDLNGNREFTLNPNYYLNLDKELREKTFSEMLERTKNDNINDFTTPYNIEKFQRYKQIERKREELGMPAIPNRTLDLFLEIMGKQQITTQQIGKATINTPITAKVEAQQVEDRGNTKENVREGEEVRDDN